MRDALASIAFFLMLAALGVAAFVTVVVIYTVSAVIALRWCLLAIAIFVLGLRYFTGYFTGV